MRNPRDFFKPLAIGAPEPLVEIPFKPSRMIHFLDFSNEKMVAKAADIATKTDILLGNLEDAVPVDRKEAAREGLIRVGRDMDLGQTALWTRVNALESGGTIKAVVRDLSDEQLVVSQGQENNARTDLSFIERSFFASRLEQREFSRDVIMSALGVDKAALSRMIALVTRLPGTLIEAVGPAPGFGRTRWADIADLMEDKPKHQAALKLIEEPAFKNFSSDDRFLAVRRGGRGDSRSPRACRSCRGGRPARRTPRSRGSG